MGNTGFLLMRKSWRTGGWLALALVLGAAFWWWKTSGGPPAPQWVTAPVQKQDLEDTVLATGAIRALRQVNVGAQATGQVKALHVKVGDVVKKGQLIAEIDDTTQQNALRDELAGIESLKAQRASRQAALTLARQNLARQQEMMAKDATSRADLQSAQNQLAAAEADLKTNAAQLEQANLKAQTARANLGYTRIAAPMDGTIVAVVTEQGQTVNAAMSTPTIVKLARLDEVKIEAQISEADVPRVKPGMAAWFTLLGEPDKRYATELKAIALLPPADESGSSDTSSSATSAASATAIYYNGILHAPNPDGVLRVSMTAQVHIVVDRVQGALTVPASALGAKDDEGRYAVRVLTGEGDEQREETRLVRVGLNNRVHAQVLEGLKEGERVITGEATPASDAVSVEMGPPPPMGP